VLAWFVLKLWRAEILSSSLPARRSETMRRGLWMVAAAVIMLGGTTGTAQAQTIRFVALLSGANETPAPGVLTGAFGTANVTLDLATRTVSWNIDVFNLPSGMSAGHFHVGGPGLAGPTVVNFTFPPNISNDFNITGSASSASNLRPEQGIRSWDDFLQALMGGQVYANIHTTVNGGGEIRGQVIRIGGQGGPGGPGGF